MSYKTFEISLYNMRIFICPVKGNFREVLKYLSKVFSLKNKINKQTKRSLLSITPIKRSFNHVRKEEKGSSLYYVATSAFDGVDT